MAVKTIGGAVSRALDFYNKDEIFFAIGKTTPWDDDANPPAATAYTTMTEIIGYRRHDFKYLVVPYNNEQVPEGTIIIEHANNSKWRVVDPADALSEGAYYVYIETTIMPEDFPTGEYRQVGIFTGLQRANGISTAKTVLLPSEVANPGILEIIDNRPPSTRNDSTREQLSFVIKF